MCTAASIWVCACVSAQSVCKKEEDKTEKSIKKNVLLGWLATATDNFYAHTHTHTNTYSNNKSKGKWKSNNNNDDKIYKSRNVSNNNNNYKCAKINYYLSVSLISFKASESRSR